MKIHQLPLGARFEYAGEEYTKTGPLLGTGKAGQRLIPKYAVLRPLDGAGALQQAQPGGSVPRAEILAAFAAFHAQCAALVPEDRRAALEAARERFLDALQKE